MCGCSGRLPLIALLTNACSVNVESEPWNDRVSGNRLPVHEWPVTDRAMDLIVRWPWGHLPIRRSDDGCLVLDIYSAIRVLSSGQIRFFEYRAVGVSECGPVGRAMSPNPR